MAHGSARASHNTGPLGVASQYRITNWGKMRDWAYRWFSLPHRNLRVFQPVSLGQASYLQGQSGACHIERPLKDAKVP